MHRSQFSGTYVDQILAGAKKVESDARVLNNLRTKVDNVLRNFHRNASYPEAKSIEITLAGDAILRAVQEAQTDALLRASQENPHVG